MGRYMRKCKRSREEVVELENAIRTSTAQKALEKKRKIGLLGDSEMTASLVRLLEVVPAANSDLPASSGDLTCGSSASDHIWASCCSSNGSSQLAEGSTDFVDLEMENEEFLATSGGDLEESSTYTPTLSPSRTSMRRSGRTVRFSLTRSYSFFRSETTPSGKAQAELRELESTTMPREFDTRRRSISVQKMPSEVELEEFFSAAETKLHKQFMDKYNYDILKDEPLEGRYEWVRIPVKP